MLFPFDINRFLKNFIRSPIGSIQEKSLEELKNLTQDSRLDTVQQAAFDKLLQALAEPYPSVEQVMKALELVSYQKKMLQEPVSPDLLIEMRKRFVTERIFTEERTRVSIGKTEEEKNKEDLALFSFAGLVTIFEYLVSLFLTYKASDRETRIWMFSAPKIDNIGFTAPGILAGIENEKTLSTFILRILNNQTRAELTRAYSEFKQGILTAEPGSEAVVKALAKFISDMLPHFYKRNITAFSMFFPDSYGMAHLNELEKYLTA